MTEFDYNRLSNIKSSFRQTEKSMRGGKYEANDIAVLVYAENLVDMYGVNGAIAYCDRYEEWQEKAIIKAHQNYTL